MPTQIGKRKVVPKVMQEKLNNLVGLTGMCRMSYVRLMKQALLFGITNGRNQRGRLHGRWTDDVMD